VKNHRPPANSRLARIGRLDDENAIKWKNGGRGSVPSDELPGPASVGEAAVRAHPVGLGHVDAGIDAIEDGTGDLWQSVFRILGGADGVNVLELGRFQFAQHVEPAFAPARWGNTYLFAANR
jgi:hypothetical protein